MPPPPTIEPAFPTFVAGDDEESDVESWKRFDPKDPRYAASPLEYQILDPRRIPWLKPPPVQTVAPGKKWSKCISDGSPSNPVIKKCREEKNA
jgi:hypothetical protein